MVLFPVPASAALAPRPTELIKGDGEGARVRVHPLNGTIRRRAPRIKTKRRPPTYRVHGVDLVSVGEARLARRQTGTSLEDAEVGGPLSQVGVEGIMRRPALAAVAPVAGDGRAAGLATAPVLAPPTGASARASLRAQRGLRPQAPGRHPKRDVGERPRFARKEASKDAPIITAGRPRVLGAPLERRVTLREAPEPQRALYRGPLVAGLAPPPKARAPPNPDRR